MRNSALPLAICLLCATTAYPQQAAAPQPQPAQNQPTQNQPTQNQSIAPSDLHEQTLPSTRTDSITVTTTVEPLAESDRSIQVLSPRDLPPGTDSVVDVLRSDPSLNLQARSGEGVQADLSIRGTTFEQSLILVNGLRVDDPETGHLNLDIPIPLDAISHIDVLHGSGSTFYGSDAIGGAVNLLTGLPGGPGPSPHLSATVRSGAGNYGSLENHLRASYSSGPVATQLTASRDQSNGFTFDRNYASNALASETWLQTKPGTTDILLAASDRPYGANNFYGLYPESERTKAWLGSIQQQLGRRTAASFGYTRHTDEFILIVTDPSIYENNHITTSYESALRRADPLGSNTTLSYGLEESGDTIRSNSLGIHARNQGAGYANLSLRSLKRLSLSLGAREEVLSSQGSVFSPSAAAAFTVTSALRLRASAGHGFRRPTYVDLYYADPATIGNPLLKPESSWSYEGGADWSPLAGRIQLTAVGFRLNQSNAIDYSKQLLATPALTAAEPWQAVNVSTLDISGAETSARIRLSPTQQLQLSYTAAHSANLPPNTLSEYAFNYAAQNAIFAYTASQLPTRFFGPAGKQITFRTQVNIVQKTGLTPYPLWDVDIARSTGAIRPYLHLLNLSNTGYTEIPLVPMQGRTIQAGLQLTLFKR